MECNQVPFKCEYFKFKGYVDEFAVKEESGYFPSHYCLNWHVVIYEQKDDPSIDKVSMEYLQAIGGQTYVWCEEHSVPFVFCSSKDNQVCGVVDCPKKAVY
jgi:hypothetical protein